MAAPASSRSLKTMDLQISKKWKHTDTSPERTKVWAEPPPKSLRKVAVVYYLCRNGHLEHPHFIEVPLSSPEGLYLKDVINRLNFLRGKGMASLYSWSAKRSYKSGFVWHDLSENDFIYPAHGQEYVLKGSELMEGAVISPAEEYAFSGPIQISPENRNSGEDRVSARRRNQSWSSADFREYRVYKAEEFSSRAAAASDASTQTDDKRRRRRPIREVEEEEGEEESKESGGKTPPPATTELSRGEISPPPSDSSPETLMKADGRLAVRPPETACGGDRSTAKPKNKSPSSVLLQLLSCGSVSFKDCGPRDHGFSLISQYKSRLPRCTGANQVEQDAEKLTVELHAKLKVEDKEYFSGSLIETKKDEFQALKRSSSYNAERTAKLDLEKEIDGVRARCIPRKAKTQMDTRKDCNNSSSNSNSIMSSCDRNQHGSKRIALQS